ncbi:MAG: Xaa-Pro peptidase family protein [Planctomycetaceae bacterium]|nr:Xaa-Pro peptidase family protein [Planctomycetaceae bacterium]
MKDRFAIRRDHLRSMIAKDGISAMLVTGLINVTYLTGFTGDDSYLLVTKDGGDTLLSDFRYQEQIGQECPGLTSYIRNTGESMPKAVQKLLKGNRQKRLAVEAGSMTLALKESFGQELGGWDFVPKSELVEQFRMIKDKTEIDLIRKAGGIAARAFECLRAGLSAAQTELELKNDLEHTMKRFGAEGVSFNSIIAVGSRTSLCHAVPGDRQVGENELLLIDWGAKYCGYVSDNTRTLVTAKKPSAKFRKIYEIVLRAHKEAAKAIAPGKRCCDIDAIARDIISDAGFGKNFGHGLGHGLGLEVHENPRFNTVTEKPLEPGMVLTVEPGIYLPGWGGIRIEDDYLVTKDGCENLTPRLPLSFEEMMVEMD